jgi:Trypsin
MIKIGNSIATFGFICTAVYSTSGFAQIVAGNAPPEDIGKEIRDYAAHSGLPGTPEYSAALRRAIAAAATSIRNGSGEYDRNRTIDVSKQPVDAGKAKPLQVDGDARYSMWLETAANNPVASLKVAGCQAMDVRVIGGESVKDPHCLAEVSLIYESPTKDFCSGVLVNDQHTVLTAAHCLCFGPIEYAIFGSNMQDVKNYRAAVIGQKGHEGVKCPGGGVSKGDSSASLAGRDIAVIRLARDVPADVAHSVPLPQPGLAQQLFAGGNKSILVVGFGFTELAPGKPVLLQDPKQKTLALSAIMSPNCSGSRNGETDEAFYGCASGQEILAVDSRPIGPCFGDSGGGGYMLVDQPGSSDRLPALVGITSRSTGTDCGDGAIYTSFTPEIISWIKNALSADR